jgi:hypothetical protein
LYRILLFVINYTLLSVSLVNIITYLSKSPSVKNDFKSKNCNFNG